MCSCRDLTFQLRFFVRCVEFLLNRRRLIALNNFVGAFNILDGVWLGYFLLLLLLSPAAHEALGLPPLGFEILVKDVFLFEEVKVNSRSLELEVIALSLLHGWILIQTLKSR